MVVGSGWRVLSATDACTFWRMGRELYPALPATLGKVKATTYFVSVLSFDASEVCMNTVEHAAGTAAHSIKGRLRDPFPEVATLLLRATRRCSASESRRGGDQNRSMACMLRYVTAT